MLLIGIPVLLPILYTQQYKGKIVVNRPVEAPYLRHSDKDFYLVFFGYVGCTKICTPMLQKLSAMYDSDEFSTLKPSVGFLFVNLMPEVQPDQPQEFARLFQPTFEGVYLDQKQLMNIDRDFAVFFSKSLKDAGELNHSDYVYLIQQHRNGVVELKTIYMTHPLNEGMMIEDIRHTIRAAS